MNWCASSSWADGRSAADFLRQLFMKFLKSLVHAGAGTAAVVDEEVRGVLVGELGSDVDGAGELKVGESFWAMW